MREEEVERNSKAMRVVEEGGREAEGKSGEERVPNIKWKLENM